MRLSILFFAALYSGIIILSFAKADSFRTINAVEVTSPDGVEILSYATQDEDFLYVSTLSPVVVSKVNKTLVATPGWYGSIQRLNISNGETVATGILDKESGLLLLHGQRKTFWVSTTNLTLLYSPSPLDRDVNPLTCFLSNNTDGTLVANFPSFGESEHFVLQLRLDDPDRTTTTNTSSIFNLPIVDVVASSYSPLNDIAVLVDYSSQFVVYKWSTKELLLTFKLRDIITVTMVYDGATNTLYTCGDQQDSYIPVLTRVNLSLVQNNTELLTINSYSSYYSNEVITAQAVGDKYMTCRALALHSSGQLFYALYDPPSSTGLIGRAVALTLDTIDTTTVDAALSQKPISLLLDDNKPLIFVFTETDVVAVKLPTTFECPLDCSGRGHCNATTNYLCVCDDPYFGHNCENPVPATPSEPPLYKPISVIGQVNVPLDTPFYPTYGSFADDEFIYFYANCSLSISKISKANVLSSTATPLVFSDTVIDSFGVSTALVDSQLGLVYFIGGDVCSYQNDFNAKLVRVSMSNYTDHTVMDLTRVTTAFISTDASKTAYLNLFGPYTSLRLKSSLTANPLQSLPTPVPADSEPTAVLFLPRSNTAVISSQYSTVHYDFNNGSIVHQYGLPSGFTAMKMAADEERGKLYVIAQSNERTCLLVLTPALIPRNTLLSMNDSNYLDAICSLYVYPSYSLFLDLESGQAIIVTDIVITRVNLKTHEIFDQVEVFRFGLSISQSYFEPVNRTLFVTSRSNVAALRIPPPCPRSCRGNGQCVYGACQCNDGFTGDQCEQVVPPVAPIAAAPIDEPISDEPVTSLPIPNITSTASSRSSLLGVITAAFMVAIMNLIEL